MELKACRCRHKTAVLCRCFHGGSRMKETWLTEHPHSTLLHRGTHSSATLCTELANVCSIIPSDPCLCYRPLTLGSFLKNLSDSPVDLLLAAVQVCSRAPTPFMRTTTMAAMMMMSCLFLRALQSNNHRRLKNVIYIYIYNAVARGFG